MRRVTFVFRTLIGQNKRKGKGISGQFKILSRNQARLLANAPEWFSRTEKGFPFPYSG